MPFALCVKVASGVIMSQILFFVNITMFDPREAFQVVNMGFYIVTLHIFAHERDVARFFQSLTCRLHDSILS